MKKVLIFTVSAGHGHNSAANSLKKELEAQAYEVLTIEPTKEISKSLDTIISDGYKVLATKLPKMYGTLYKISNYQVLNNRLTKLCIRTLEEKIYNIILEHKPRLIICTHPMFVNVISNIKDEKGIEVPFISVVTDYQAHKSYVNKNVDAYIAGSIYTKDSLIKKGVDGNRVYAYGIPVRREFHTKKEKNESKSEFTILLMGGSMGVNAIKKSLKNLLKVDYPLRMIVICGNNETLKKSLENKYGSGLGNKIIEIIGFTSNVPEYMDISDVIISKPGGLTVSESLIKNIPMIIPYYIPGQEKENTDVLVNAGVAKKSEVKELSQIITELIENPVMLQKMKQNILEITKTHSLDSTVDLAVNLMNEYEEIAERRIKYGG
ncbi:processive 1,2-diacylglycerol beta-glucosyltransferase [Natranaerovirga pectinivora]|uniref:Processive 1,2-diacylglycerol beta-glucosyltransferase n=1 Tax=Natranaerovirga pectinivora TaxID=682400 RepID=A0A4R3ML39_9FIRM|nr:glycosyltransferase [Natranaerovirga pectinivora]TCT14686.1 processive 1,2-diacylglycerol beta-glucosyltransferase [Natranaerovirga pectinivora]